MSTETDQKFLAGHNIVRRIGIAIREARDEFAQTPVLEYRVIPIGGVGALLEMERMANGHIEVRAKKEEFWYQGFTFFTSVLLLAWELLENDDSTSEQKGI